ncbi:DUF1045 domain-containing protein [Alsobacter sp. SYSU M60028]|uniref:DUF1045 domain-containing protein n=1 Tax=Alsobacter ponti TaxID=2962936 RepID=A0ABT1L7B2_9HYPH|nr:DUF1045 domain-containing protein [Alsobacter ponti]MCP8937366.1 DUF1045 domain-containing protein [Alsobacter ponti]
MTSAPRYALYYAPAPEAPLWRFGSSVIGYDAATGADVPLAVPAGWDEPSWRAASDEPRRYGFHATLKAPMRLAAGQDEAALLAAVAAFAARRSAVTLDGLAARPLGRFVALIPAAPSEALQQLAAEVVEAFEPFRAPPTEAELARRLAAGLSPREQEYLARYGYPYVRERFRFHMTLSGPVGEGAGALADVLDRAFRHAVPARPARIDRIAVFRQETPQDRFRILASVELAG